MPKEVRNAIKAEYLMILNNPRMDKCDSVYLCAFENIFARHNITSDTEPEEMLMVKRKKVQEAYRYPEGYADSIKGTIMH